jgi:hypothetical protein
VMFTRDAPQNRRRHPRRFLGPTYRKCGDTLFSLTRRTW